MSGKEELNEYVSILNADCLEYMRTVADNTFDLAVVDPDFGLNEKISKGGTWAAKYKGFDGALGGDCGCLLCEYEYSRCVCGCELWFSLCLNSIEKAEFVGKQFSELCCACYGITPKMD